MKKIKKSQYILGHSDSDYLIVIFIALYQAIVMTVHTESVFIYFLQLENGKSSRCHDVTLDEKLHTSHDDNSRRL